MERLSIRMNKQIFLSVIFVLTSLVTAASKGSTQTAVVGLRTDNYSFEKTVRNEVSKRLSGQRNVSLIPEVVTHNYVSDLWREEAKNSKNKIRLARKYFIEGKKLYDKLVLDQAIRQFNRSVNAYREGVGALKDNRYLLVSHLYLGMSLIVLGKEREGQQYIREMIILDPKRDDRVLSKREFPPRVIELHKALTQKVLKGPSGQLNIEVEPADAKIYLNGLLQKTDGPFSTQLPVGEHFVVVERKGYRQVAKPIQIRSKPNFIKIKLEEWQPLSPYSLQRRNNLIALDDLGNISKELSAKMLILGSIEPVPNKDDTYVLLGQVYDARSREFSKIQKVETSLGRMDKAAKSFARKISNQITTQGLVVADIRTAGSSPVAYDQAQDFEKKISKNYFDKKAQSKKKIKNKKGMPTWMKNKWVWYGVGAAAALAGGYVLYDQVLAGSDKNTLTITPSP
ncbi:PEGA domain-containing protein [bacterium]|nr:PEGA domain-containing protein [bacterium]